MDAKPVSSEIRPSVGALCVLKGSRPGNLDPLSAPDVSSTPTSTFHRVSPFLSIFSFGLLG